jgi:hypothetical protein
MTAIFPAKSFMVTRALVPSIALRNVCVMPFFRRFP